MVIISAGRVNIPHIGHIKTIEMCDYFYLAEGVSKNKLPHQVRYDYLVRMYPHIKDKIRIGKPAKVVHRMTEKDVFLGTEDVIIMPKCHRKRYSIVDRVTSSTYIRELVDKNDIDMLRSLYETEFLIEQVYELRKMELSYVYTF